MSDERRAKRLDKQEMRKRIFFNTAVVGLLVAGIVLTFYNQRRLSSYSSFLGRTEQPNVQSETVGDGKNITTLENVTVASHRPRRNITLVAHLHGEMGNNLGVLAHAYAVRLAIERTYPHISIHLVGQRQRAPKWKSTAQNLQTCFPSLRDFQFEGGRWDSEHRIRREQQNTWLQLEANKSDSTDNRLDVDESCPSRGLCWRETAEFLQTLLDQQIENPDLKGIQEPPNATVSLPFLSSRSMSILDVLVDEYYDEIRKWLTLDAACCKERPEPDEVVFHLRNFAAENPGLLLKGYQELDPNSTAELLFAKMRPGEKIAIVSRFADKVQPYVVALESRGLSVRVIRNQTSVQDFCFLQSTKRELVGAKMSTFVTWAAVLGDAEQALLYAVNSSWTKKRGKHLFDHHTSSRKELRDRLVFQTYRGREDNPAV
jgi:hypothetical protein